MQRACELAARGRGNTAPNPAVGAVVVREGRVVGEGFHHRRGEAHAEIEALAACAGEAAGATLYVTLEPCNHQGLTPPCTHAIVDAKIARVVVGTLDPNPKTAAGGVRYLREHGISVDVVDAPCARELIEDFAAAVAREYPYVTLKLAASLDGYVTSQRGERQQLTGERAMEFVRELRAVHDAVMVGAGTVRADDPLLTVRPPRTRLRPYTRVVACEEAPISARSRVLRRSDALREAGYEPTIVLAPAGSRDAFATLEGVADVIFVGDASAKVLDLRLALGALKRRGISSLLCEGGPTIATRLLQRRLVDRLHWIVAPRLLAGAGAVPALTCNHDEALVRPFAFDTVRALGDDFLLSANLRETT
ncbi:MAG TPA: bifunctional diaminohydroxyphosphoribosylaminopyrimidine deaminase/5-amino-6-(5-phosphoribosylamino)uracil reductase RibD [Candidatus Acidoferrales bacterium]|nr:bifunctional diaminohydroxyphosphoribosylaminopyrimidine deaminase/5-amino-6-(5-phosphoribosylamino)uracil reductase RibD [Candidatus Acidoferrales bacterium]